MRAKIDEQSVKELTQTPFKKVTKTNAEKVEKSVPRDPQNEAQIQNKSIQKTINICCWVFDQFRKRFCLIFEKFLRPWTLTNECLV